MYVICFYVLTTGNFKQLYIYLYTELCVIILYAVMFMYYAMYVICFHWQLYIVFTTGNFKPLYIYLYTELPVCVIIFMQ